MVHGVDFGSSNAAQYNFRATSPTVFTIILRYQCHRTVDVFVYKSCHTTIKPFKSLQSSVRLILYNLLM